MRACIINTCVCVSVAVKPTSSKRVRYFFLIFFRFTVNKHRVYFLLLNYIVTNCFLNNIIK